MSAVPETLDHDLRHGREFETRAAFPELSLVSLLEDVPTDGSDVIIPAGSVGTVVHVHGGGSGYIVEFVEPAGALTSVDPGQLRAA